MTVSALSELDSLQVTLNAAIDTIRVELRSAGYPELSTLATQPHPLDETSNLPSRRLFEAQTTAVGKHLPTSSLFLTLSDSRLLQPFLYDAN
jgi:hypothetical protein